MGLDYGFVFGDNCVLLFVECTTAGTGDVNLDGLVNISDVVFLIEFINEAAPEDECLFQTADVSGDGEVT